MKAIAIFSKEKWLRALELAGVNAGKKEKVVQVYKEIGGRYQEGSAAELDGVAKYILVELGRERKAGKATKKKPKKKK